jgi:hypothetical protein
MSPVEVFEVGTFKWLIVTAAIVVAQGCASTGGAPQREVIGKVEGVFVEALPGVLVDRRIANPEADGPVWANVRLRTPLDDGRTFMSAKLDRGVLVERGDMVSVRLTPENTFSTVVPAPDTVVAVMDMRDVGPSADDGETRKVSLLDHLR